MPYPDEVTRLRERLNDAKECFRAQRARITELERKNHEYAARIDQLERDLHGAMASLTQLRLELAGLCAQNAKLLAAPPGHGQLVRQLTRLAADVHPDRWGGNPIAEECVKAVLALRDQLREGRP